LVCDANLAQNYVYRWGIDARCFYRQKATLTARVIQKDIGLGLFSNPTHSSELPSGDTFISKHPQLLSKVINVMKTSKNRIKARREPIRGEADNDLVTCHNNLVPG